jgi:hypothetical protein
MDLFSIQTYPRTVQFAIYSLVAAWGVFLWSVYQYFGPEFFNRFAIGGILIVFFVLRLKNWARLLCLCANLMAVLYCALFGMLFLSEKARNPAAAFFSALCVLLFLVSSYFLLVKPTREFYKKATPPGSGPFPSETGSDGKKE